MALPTGLTPISGMEEEEEDKLPMGLAPIAPVGLPAGLSPMESALPEGLTAITAEEAPVEPEVDPLPDAGAMLPTRAEIGFGEYKVGMDVSPETSAFLVGVGHSMAMVPRGIEQIAAKSDVLKKVFDLDEESLKLDEEAMDELYADPELGGVATAGMITGAVVEPVGLMLPGMKAAKVGGAIVKGAARANIARAAAGGAVYGAAAYTKEVEGESFAESKAKQVATYTAFGAGAGVIFGGALRRADKGKKLIDISKPKGMSKEAKKAVDKAYTDVKNKLIAKNKEAKAAGKELVETDHTGVWIAADKQMNDIDQFVAKGVIEGSVTDAKSAAAYIRANAPDKVEGLFDATKITGRKPKLKQTMQEAQDTINFYTKAAKQSDISVGVDSLVGMVSTRLGNKSQRILGRMEKYYHGNNTHERKAMNAVTPFMENSAKIFGKGKMLRKDSAEYLQFKSKILSGDFDGVRNMLKAKGYKDGSPELKGIDELTNWMSKRGDDLVAHNVLDKGQVIDNYFPRMVKDLEGLKKELGSKARTKLEDALKKAERISREVEKRPLNPGERAAIINKSLVKYPTGIKTKGGAYAKKRTIEDIPPELAKFYEDPMVSLHSYIRNSTQDIGKAKLFGVDKAARKSDGIKNVLDSEVSIGRLIDDELQAGNISPSDVEEVTGLLNSVMGIGEQAPSALIQNTKNVLYSALLSNPVSAAVQVGDVAISMHVNGFRNTVEVLFPAAKAAIKNSDDSLAQIMGLSGHITEDMTSRIKSGDFLSKTMKYSGFTTVDRIGKETALRAALNKANKLTNTRKMVNGKLENTGMKEFIKLNKAKYGDEVYKMAEDLKNGVPSEEARVYLFSELSRMQPISKLEMPQVYHDHPNGRIMYMLKSFMLKQMDLVRRDSVQKLASKNMKVKKEGIRNLASISAVLMAGGTAGGVTQEVVKGNFEGAFDDVADPEELLNTLFKTFGLGGFFQRKVMKGEPMAAVLGLGVPPVAMFDRALHVRKDELQVDKDSAMKMIPVVGKVMYYWLNNGVDKELASKAYWAKQEEYKQKRIARREANE